MATHGTTVSPSSGDAAVRTRRSLTALLPGLAAAATGAVGATALAGLVPGASPLLIGIVLGLVARNLGLLPVRLTAGLAVAGRVPLRLGIVVLGLQLSVRDLATLGWGVPVLAAAVVGIGIIATIAMGRALGVAPRQALLIACGFSICGAAAVAGVESVVAADEEETVTAVTLVVLFGTLMIPTIPFLAAVFGMPQQATALWAGASIHEVAQVVGAGGIIGGGALGLAVTVKLARVLMLAPVAALLAARERRNGEPKEGTKPPLVPLFVLGFVAMVGLRSIVPVPHEVLGLASAIQSFLLTTAMLALGAGVRLGELIRRGGRAVVLAAASTIVVAIVGYIGARMLA